VSTEGSGFHELAVEASPSGIVICDEAGKILLANRRLESMFGYAPTELLGRTIDTLVPIELRAAHAKDRARYWRRPATRAMGAGRELFGRRRDGTTIPVEIGLTVAVHEGRRVVVASVIDVTERLEHERKLRAVTAERLEIERLVSGLAARFVNIPPERVDEAIVDSQRRIVEALGLDRSALWQFTENDADLVLTHVWVRPECPPPPAEVSTRELFPWLLSKVRAGEAIWNATVDDVPDPVDRENLRRLDTRSDAIIPLTADGRVIGAASFGAMRAERSWSPEIRERLTLIATVFSHALARRQSHQRLHRALTQVEELRQRLARENVRLRQEVSALTTPRPLVAESAAARAVLDQIRSVAPTAATVLLMGETGCGKEVFAQAIHDLSDRRGRPMVRVNCAAIPAALIENELFGRERGAYTGALSRQVGRFELADGATLFLDEIGELPLESQVKLLRVVQDRVVERLGSTRPINVDVRLIAATNRDLRRAVADRTFREDLYYRLNVFPIHVPPLRERVEDIPVLAWNFIEEFSTAFGKPIESISKESLAAFQAYPWPGNVRELRNLIERAVILATGPRLVVDPPASPETPDGQTTLAEFEAEHIREVLERVGWRVRGQGGAAQVLGMKATTLDSRMAKLGIRRPTA
jgi:PAS domain S-box-containing protein